MVHLTLLHLDPINISVSDNHWEEKILSEVPKSMFISLIIVGKRLAISCGLIHTGLDGSPEVFGHECIAVADSNSLSSSRML